MRKALKYVAVAAIALSAAGCKDDLKYQYQAEQNAVYFDYEGGQGIMRQLNFNFFDVPNESELLFEIPVRISGPRVDYDRHFKVVAQPAPTGTDALPNVSYVNTYYAEAGKHYTLPAEGVIPAGQGVGYVQLMLLNTDPLMNEQYFQLRLNLVASDDFDVAFSGKPTDANDTYLNTVWVTFSQLLTMPDWWNPSVPQNWSRDQDLGAWGPMKNVLFRLITGQTELAFANSATYAVPLAVVRSFRAAIRDPHLWAPENGATITANGKDPEGNDKFKIQFSEGGREFEFRVNKALSNTVQWLDEKDEWSIFYQN